MLPGLAATVIDDELFQLLVRTWEYLASLEALKHLRPNLLHFLKRQATVEGVD
jgi:hypothetical protein